MTRMTIQVEKMVGADLIPYLVQSACHYESSLYIECENKSINMKSIMGMTILRLNKGTSFELIADGDDEEKAVNEIAECFA